MLNLCFMNVILSSIVLIWFIRGVNILLITVFQGYQKFYQHVYLIGLLQQLIWLIWLSWWNLYGSLYWSIIASQSSEDTTASQLQENYLSHHNNPGNIFQPTFTGEAETSEFSREFREFEELLELHDVIINSISRHCSNTNKPLSPKELIDILSKYRHRITALIYWNRACTPHTEVPFEK